MKWPEMQDLTVATRSVATKSALNPALWLCGLSTPIGLVGASFAEEPTNYILLTIALIPIVNAVRAYTYFMKSDPDRLQSERFLIEKQVVARLGVNGENAREILLKPASVTDNPSSMRGQDD